MFVVVEDTYFENKEPQFVITDRRKKSIVHIYVIFHNPYHKKKIANLVE